MHSPYLWLDDPLKTVHVYSADLVAKMQGIQRWYQHETYGWQRLRFVRNNSGSTIATGMMLAWGTGSQSVAAPSAVDALAAFALAGITQIAIPTGYCAWVVAQGNTLYTADQATDVDDLLFTDYTADAGRLGDPAVAGLEHCVVGRSLTAASGAGSTAVAYINLP